MLDDRFSALIASVILAVSAIAVPASVHAAGFAVGEQGAAARGVGGAATARPDLGESGFYNPAAFGFAESLSIAIGASGLAPSVAHVHPKSGERTGAQTGFSTPPYFHAGYRFGDFAAGVSFDVPFGSGLSWPTDWRGRFEVTAIDLQVFEIAGAFVWRPIEELAIAAGPRLELATVGYARQIDAVDSEASVQLTGDATGVGGQLAVMYQPTDQLTLGLSWRSRVRLEFSGWADFEDVPVELSQKAHDQLVTTEITLPDRIALGAAYRFSEGLFADAIASVDLTYWTWSTFQEFGIDFEDDQTPDVTQPRDWNDSVTLAAGWEQRGWIDDVAFRAGLAFDSAPSPTDTLSPSSPDGNRLIPSVGAGYTLVDGLQLDVGYGHVVFMGAKATGQAFPGRYEASAELVSLGLTYRPE
jgi:long-chain fatty acid transport protein